MLGLPERIVIFDTECTSWEGAMARNWSGPGEHRELVEIGAILVETDKFREAAELHSIMKPKLNPNLSDYFIKLSGISQEKVDNGFDFPSVLRLFSWWCKDYPLYTFDRVGGGQLFDREVLIENCDLWGVEFPFCLERFHNIKEIFDRYGYKVEQSGRAPSAFGIKLPARPHSALNDARGLLIGLEALSGRIR